MIPYRPFPSIAVGPLDVHVFGLAAAAGFLVGAAVLARHARRHGLDARAVQDLAVRLLVVGVVGARVAFVLSEPGRFRSDPLAAFAVWQGGLQFFGGFMAGAGYLWWWLRRRRGIDACSTVDGIACGLVAGVAVGRIGCVAVGEHLGRTTSFPLGLRYRGGETVEGPLAVGTTVHSTALYEILGLLVLLALLAAVGRRRVAPGALALVAGAWYGVQRFLTDFLRAYDERLAGLTVAQYTALALLAATATAGLRRSARRRPAPAPATAGAAP